MTKPELAAALELWAKKKKSVDKINADAERELEPFLQAYEKKAEPIITARDATLSPLLAELETLEKQIGRELLSLVTADGTAPAPLTTKNAIGQVNVDRKREIAPDVFMRAVPPRLRLDPAYASCFSVLMGKVDKFLDAATVARIARPKLTHSVSLTLKTD